MRAFFKIIIFVLLIVGGYFAYKSYFGGENEVVYKSINPKVGDISKSIEAVGEVFAVDMVDVGAQVSGQIKKLYVKVGDKVKKGDKIADIDDEKQNDEIKRQEAELKIYQARLKSNKISLEIVKKDYEREKALFQKNATSQESLEKAKNTYISQSAQIEEIEANIIQANIALNTAKTNLAYTKIISPMDGTVISVPAKEGQTVNANQSTPNIAIVANLRQMEIKMQVAEGDITKVKVGQKIRFSILSDEKIFNATLSSIDPAYTVASDNLSSNSSSSAVYYYAKFIVSNEDDILKIGMSVQNTIIIEEKKDVLLLPLSAIYNDSVYVLKGKKPVKTNIKVGINDGINVEILNGLHVKDNVIISPTFDEKTNSKNQKMKIRVR